MELLERGAVWQKLDGVLAEALAGNGRLTLISGEAGIGKTSLVETFTNHHKNKLHILWGSCDDLFTPRPLGPLHDMAMQTQGQFATLLQSEPDRSLIFSSFLSELYSPTIIIFEDIHWADEATLDLLKYLGRRIQQTSTLLIATYRNDELNPQHPLRLLLGDLVRHSATHRFELTALSVNAVHHLIGNRFLNAEALHKQTGGNPFFISEILAATAEDSIPTTIKDAILARVARLSEAGWRALHAAAVIGARIESWLLTAVIPTQAKAIDQCLNLGILQTNSDHLTFRHELARQTILDTIPPHQLAVLHQAVLAALQASPLTQHDTTRLAHHAAAAGDRAAILAYVPFACEAARQAGMPRAEAALWALMIQHASQLSSLKQAELYENYGLSCRTNPDKSISIKAYRQALKRVAGDEHHPQIKGRLLVRLATMLVTNAQVDEAIDTIDQALSILEPLSPSLPLALAYKNRAYQLLIRGEFEASVGYAEKAFALAQQLEDIYTIMSTLDTLGLCWLPVNHAQGREYMEQTLTLTLEHNGFWRAGSVYPNLSMTYVDIYQLERAETLIEEGLRFTVEHDSDLANATLTVWQGMAKLYRGEWNAADKIVRALFLRPQLHLISKSVAYAVLGRLLARRGQAGADEMLDQSLALFQETNNLQRTGVVYTARAEAAWLAGNEEKVRTEVEAFYETALANRQPGFAAELAYWNWKIGGVVEIYDWMVRPFILQIRGDWRGAAHAWQQLGCPYEQARALAEGDNEAQAQALLIFEQLGARPMAEKVRQGISAVGAQMILRGPRPTTQGNPFGLTNRQVDILMLLTEHLTNAEIAARLHISPKTVDHHVSAVLAKLNVSSRREAAKLAQQHPAL